ncbi:MAG: hypothetical protein ACD_37C00412G0003, partial [uncultured bacterium]
MVSLDTNIRSLPGIYKRYASLLEKLEIFSLRDFLFHIPTRYDDYSLISKISDVQPGEIVTIRGEVADIKNQYTRRSFSLQKAKIKDETGEINIIWFNQPYIAKNISLGDKISLSGKIDLKGVSLQMISPDYEIGEINFLHTGRLVPVYPETRGVSSKWLRRQIFKLLTENINEIEEFMPEDLLKRNKLEILPKALLNIHFP